MQAEALKAPPIAVGEIVVETIDGWEQSNARFHVVVARTRCTVTLARIPAIRLTEEDPRACSPTNYYGHALPGPADAVLPDVAPIRKRVKVIDGWELIGYVKGQLFGSHFRRWDGKPIAFSRTD